MILGSLFTLSSNRYYHRRVIVRLRAYSTLLSILWRVIHSFLFQFISVLNVGRILLQFGRNRQRALASRPRWRLGFTGSMGRWSMLISSIVPWSPKLPSSVGKPSSIVLLPRDVALMAASFRQLQGGLRPLRMMIRRRPPHLEHILLSRRLHR